MIDILTSNGNSVISDADKTIKQLQAENKLLREEIERLKKQRNEAQALLNQYAKPGQTFGFSNLDV